MAKTTENKGRGRDKIPLCRVCKKCKDIMRRRKTKKETSSNVANSSKGDSKMPPSPTVENLQPKEAIIELLDSDDEEKVVFQNVTGKKVEASKSTTKKGGKLHAQGSEDNPNHSGDSKEPGSEVTA